MSIDCHHWVGFELAAERHENARLKAEIDRLKSTLADIADITKDVERPPINLARSLLEAQDLQAAARSAYRYQDIHRLPASGLLGNLFGNW